MRMMSRLGVVVVICAVVLGIGAPLSGYEEDARAVNGEGDVIVQGAGASFPYRLYSSAIFAYQFAAPNVEVSYESMGSGSGQCRIRDFGTYCKPSDTKRPIYIDFAGSDSVLDESAYAAESDLQMYPAVAGAVVPIYNLPTVDALNHTLILNTTVLAQIFRKCDGSIPQCLPGSISQWDDPTIVELNQHVPGIAAALTAAGEIEVVIRQDKSGTSEIFRKALTLFEPTGFGIQIGEGPDNGDYYALVSKHDTNVGVAGRVAVTPGSIGYSVLGEALTVDIKFADIKKTSSSQPVRASADSVGNAVTEKGLDFGFTEQAKLRLNANISDAKGSQAWPIVGYTYFVVRKNTTREGANCANVKATQDFFEWFYTNSVPQSLAINLGFAPLRDSVRDLVLGRVRADMYCDGQQVFQDAVVEPFSIDVFGFPESRAILEQYQISYGVLSANTLFNNDFRMASQNKVVDFLDNEGPIAVALTSEILNDVLGKWTQTNDLKKFVRIPYFAIGLGALYNFCGSAKTELECSSPISELVMSLDVLARILSKEITRWDDSAIEDLNPNVTLPNEFITVIGIQNGNQDPLDRRFVSLIRTLTNRPTFEIVPDLLKENTEEQRSAIATIAYSIGFTSLIGDAELMDSNFVSILKAGTPVKPTIESVAACITEGAYDAQNKLFDLQSQVDLVDNCYPLTDSANIIARKAFSGAQECNKGTGTGETTTKFLGFLFANTLGTSSGVNLDEPLLTQNVVPLSSSLNSAQNANVEQLNAITCNGGSILNIVEQTNWIPTGLKLASFVIVGLFLIFCVYLSIWTHMNRKRRIILFATPQFLQQMLVGAAIASLAILPLAMDEEFLTQQQLDMACMSAPFLYTIGFVILFSSLHLKAWRLGLIFSNPKLRKIYVTNERMRRVQLAILLVCVALLITWVFVDPLIWERVVILETDSGVVLESYGRCASEKALLLASPVAAILVATLIYGIYQIYQSRNVPNEFDEGKHIGLSVLTAFEVLVLGIPILYIASDNPIAGFIVKLAIVIATSIAPIAFVFVPKVYRVYMWGWQADPTSSSGQGSDNASDARGVRLSVYRAQGSGRDTSYFDDSFFRGSSQNSFSAGKPSVLREMEKGPHHSDDSGSDGAASTGYV